ncbi:MAG: PEP-CTERM sorting domain-containing protein [Cyanobacteria bacterium Co-bin13]|nr:PEP-CTERM sorting domain-containing protein [Cyanobacteria bacterium Co-bin13]
MLERVFSGFATAAAAIALSPQVASAATLSFVQPEVAGTFTPLVPVNPGEYGFEGRGGSPTTWELGVGTQTSFGGSFNEADFVWDAPQPFEMTWAPGSLVSVTVGTTSLSYSADWQVGNAIRVIAKRNALLSISEVDGQGLVGGIGSIAGTGLEKLYIAGDSLLDGWTLKGQIQIAPGGNSRNEVLITSGTFTPAEPVPEPLTTAALFLVATAGLGLTRRALKA